MVANVNFFWNSGTTYDTSDLSYVSTTPKTPLIGEAISSQDIRTLFGKGNEPTSPGLELDNYQGVDWWSPQYPHSKGKFGSTGPISFDDLHNKHAEDPIGAGIFVDRFGSTNIKNFVVPPFRQWIRFEIWGGGGGAGAANYYSGSNGGAGQSSSIFGIIAGGGGGGVGGVRVGNINGSIGSAGIISGSLNTVCTYFASNGLQGNPGEAQNARGNVGGNSGNTANFLINAQYINQYSVKRVGTEVVVTLTGNVYTEFYSSGTGGARGGRYFDPSPRGTNAGYDGGAPGGGGGSGGWSELKDYDKRDSRGSGGSGGGGAYASFYFERSQMAVGNTISYTVGAGGAGGLGSYGNGGYGANGVLKVTWI
jgi:hypothetical protein